jgi:prepilin-type N-terminal cleavage/methylation domain-containing protein
MRRIEGFSLVELIMVIVILGILAAFVGPVLFNAMRSYDRIQTSVATHAKMRYAMERMARELRDIRRQTTDATFFDIASMSAASMAFFKTDGTQVIINAAGNQVNLAYVTSTIVAGMLTDQVGSFTLAYFETNATPVDAASLPAMAASLSFVEISLTLTEGTNLFPARLRVDLRNPR